MNDLSKRISDLSTDQRDLLMQQLKNRREVVRPSKASLREEFFKADLEAEAILDPRIRPESVLGEFNTRPNNIFITGGTGFLGAFLIYELLKQTRATLFCLVRADDVKDGKRRLRNNLQLYTLWRNYFDSRIVPIIGNLSRPYLGISEEKFQELASQIDVIYHSGAQLNFAFPYKAMKPINVLGTQEVLRLACQVKRKTVHHISSFSVFESDAYTGQVVSETDGLDHSEGMCLGYAQSKWVAEKMVLSARSRGLPACVFRLPFISGDSRTGIWNTKDFTCIMYKGCIMMGTAPNLEYNDMLTLAPVDYVSQAVTYLSRQRESAGKTFHLNNPHPVQAQDLASKSRSARYSVRNIPYEDWQAQLAETVQSPENPLFPLKPFFLEKLTDQQISIPELYERSRGPKIDCKATRQALAGTAIACPPIDLGLMAAYFSYFLRSGFIGTRYLGRSAAFFIHSFAFVYRSIRQVKSFLMKCWLFPSAARTPSLKTSKKQLGNL